VQRNDLGPWIRQRRRHPADPGRLSDKGELLSQLVTARGLAPEVTVMVGDRKHDVIGARTAGLQALAVAYGYGSREELVAAAPDGLCDTPADIPRALAALGTPLARR